MHERSDLIVIGGGPAGVTAALRAAELGADVTLLERGRLGGTCTDDGCAPTRVLAKAARLMRDSEQLRDFGMTGATPELDLSALMAATQRTVYRIHEKKQLPAHLERAGATVEEGVGDVRFVDPHTVRLADGSERSASRLIVACGGHARRIDFPGGEHALTHGDVWAMTRVPRRLIIIGGAATGVQLASVFAAFGASVTVLEVAPRILASEDLAVSSAITAGFADRGIEVVAGIEGVDRMERRRDGWTLTYRLTDEARELACDAVILAVGWAGNIEAMNLPGAGITTDHGYVVVDDSLRTSVPHIWAAGDVTGRMMLVQSATHEGRVAAQNAMTGDPLEVRHEVVAHGGFTDPEYGSVGVTEAQAGSRGRATVTGSVPYADLDRAVIDGHSEGFCTLVVDAADHRLIGAHVVGEQAVEVVQIAAAAIAADMRVERLAEVEFAYPTFTAIVGLAARQAVHALRLPGEEARAWESLGRRRVAEWERREA